MFLAEMQVRYIMDMLKKMLTQRLGAVEKASELAGWIQSILKERVLSPPASLV
jgi:hypothetical protein